MKYSQNRSIHTRLSKWLTVCHSPSFVSNAGLVSTMHVISRLWVSIKPLSDVAQPAARLIRNFRTNDRVRNCSPTGIHLLATLNIFLLLRDRDWQKVSCLCGSPDGTGRYDLVGYLGSMCANVDNSHRLLAYPADSSAAISNCFPI